MPIEFVCFLTLRELCQGTDIHSLCAHRKERSCAQCDVGQGAHHVADGGDVELQAWLKAAPHSPADMADLLPELPLIVFAQIDDLLHR